MRELLPLLVLLLQAEKLTALTSPFNYGSASNNKATLDSLEWFSSAKLGMFIHDGPVTQWGTEISFPLICTSLPCTGQGANKSAVNITTIAELKAHREPTSVWGRRTTPRRSMPLTLHKLPRLLAFNTSFTPPSTAMVLQTGLPTSLPTTLPTLLFNLRAISLVS
jgi:hypothetical protein